MGVWCLVGLDRGDVNATSMIQEIIALHIANEAPFECDFAKAQPLRSNSKPFEARDVV